MLFSNLVYCGTTFRLRIAYDYDHWSHLKRVRRDEPNGETYWEAQASDRKLPTPDTLHK